jgi:hypothetical protein
MAAVCSSPAETISQVIGGSKAGGVEVGVSSDEQLVKSKANPTESITDRFFIVQNLGV